MHACSCIQPRVYGGQVARRTGWSSRRKIDNRPLRFRVAFYATLTQQQRPIFGVFRRVRVIRRRARHICIEDSFRWKRRKKGGMDRVPQGKRCLGVAWRSSPSYRFASWKTRARRVWSGGRSMKNSTLLADFGTFFRNKGFARKNLVGTRFELNSRNRWIRERRGSWKDRYRNRKAYR